MNARSTPESSARVRALLEDVRTAAAAGSGALDAELRAAVLREASGRALGQRGTGGGLPPDVDRFIDEVLQRPTHADVAALVRGGRTEAFVYELAVVTAVAAGNARGRAAFALLDAAQRGDA